MNSWQLSSMHCQNTRSASVPWRHLGDKSSLRNRSRSINVEIISFNPVGHSHPSSLAFVTGTLTNGQKRFWTIGSLNRCRAKTSKAFRTAPNIQEAIGFTYAFFLSWTMQPVFPMASVFSAPRSIGRVYCRLGFVIIQNERQTGGGFFQK